MAEPTVKAQEVEDLLIKTFGFDRREAIKANHCSWCKAPIDGFRDTLSEKEYTISGFCQKCQDDTFGK